MRNLDKNLLEQLSGEMTRLSSDMLESERFLLKQKTVLHPAHHLSARNLAHYLALRRHDVRELQSQLSILGLSSLGRTESHVLNAVQTVHRVLNALLGSDASLPSPEEHAIEIGEGSELLEANTEALLGPPAPGRRVRIMVTMSSDAATNYELVRDLVRNGMDCMRINCAHDGPEAWLGMICNLRKAREEVGRHCRILMDMAGPEPAPNSGAPCIPLAAGFLKKLRPGDKLRMSDSRGAQRTLRISDVVGKSFWAEATQTIYFAPGLAIRTVSGAKSTAKSAKNIKSVQTRIGPLPPLPQMLTLHMGDTLILQRGNAPGKPARYRKTGELIEPARIGVSLPQILDHAKSGEPVWFDDGKIGGVIRSANADCATVEITQARPEGEKLAAEKGINLPETLIDIPALSADDREALKFIVQHADLVGYSFVHTETDVRELLDLLEQVGGQKLGLILKIETRKGFENLPKLILAAMRTRSFGVMIARGDLAVECGYQRLAEVQEEILWISEAAHVPVIWATQVLETLAKKGVPSRSEITDAAMGERAECVMLNKGPYTVTAVRVLADILKRMQEHQEKKRSILRPLRLAASLSTD